MLTAWFLAGAIVGTIVTLMLYFAARNLNSAAAYGCMFILPVIFNIMIWGLLKIFLGIPAWYLAGAVVAIFASFITGLLAKFVSPALAYIITFIIPAVVSFAAWILFTVIINLWGAYHV